MPLDNKKLRSSLITKILISVGSVLLVALSAWSYFNINYVEKKFMDDLLDNMDRLSNTIRLGMHYAMMTNSRDDIKETINNISRQNEIENIRIYNKQGRIKFSNQADEVDHQTNIKDEACHICHHSNPPITAVPLKKRIRIFTTKGSRGTGIGLMLSRKIIEAHQGRMEVETRKGAGSTFNFFPRSPLPNL